MAKRQTIISWKNDKNCRGSRHPPGAAEGGRISLQLQGDESGERATSELSLATDADSAGLSIGAQQELRDASHLPLVARQLGSVGRLNQDNLTYLGVPKAGRVWSSPVPKRGDVV